MLRHLYYSLVRCAFCVAAAITVSSALAQNPLLDIGKPKKEAEASSAVALDNGDAKRQDAAARLRIAQAELEAAKAAGQGSTSSSRQKAQEVDLRDQIERVIAQQQDTQQRKKELQATCEELEHRLSEVRKKKQTEASSRSFLVVDELRDNLSSELQRQEAVRSSVVLAGETLERAKTTVDAKQRRRLALKDAGSTSKSQATPTESSQSLATAELEAELAEEILILRRKNLENEKLAERAYHLKITLLQEKIALLSSIAEFEEQDLQAQIASLDKQTVELKRKLLQAEPEAIFLEQRWFDARRRAEEAAEKGPELEEEVEARRLAYLAQQQYIAVLNARIRRLTEMRTAWNRRFKVARQTVDETLLVNWVEEAEELVEQLQSEARIEDQKSSEVRKKLAELEEKRDQDGLADPARIAWREQQQESLSKLRQAYEMNLVGIEASLRLHEKLLAEMQEDAGASLGSQLASGWQWLKDLWDYPVATVEDRPVTIRKIVIAIVVLIIGIFISRSLSRIFVRSLLSRLGIFESAFSAIQTITYYILVLFFVFFALHVANVPLTAFTLLGGALALGLGFGSQNIVSNFISGLILLAERPIRTGDLIQVDGLFAVVEKIGARSTRVKTGSNLEIMVPNSKFLENNVTNWTLSSTMVRSDVQVGVVYGSPIKQVEELLIQAAKAQEWVLDDPTPFVWFLDFGDNSLKFQLNFWIHMTSLTRRLTIESQIRFTIDELFREAEIVIAFPQRDVHLDTARPLEVRMLPPDEPVPVSKSSQSPDAA